MPYRRIDLVLPGDADLNVADICDELKLLDVTEHASDEGQRRRISLLLRADQTEPILETLDKRYGEHEHFSAAVIELAALLPRPNEQEEDGKEDDSDSAERARNRISREELLDDLEPGTQISRVYLLTVLLSSIIASVGLIRDNAAVVIGAMVIAPLLLPNMSLALGTTLGDGKMMVRSLWTNVAGVAVCLAFSYAVGFFVPFDPEVQQIALRTSVSYSDVVLALAAGMAGAIAVTSGVSANLIGVMVAVALLPPMVAFGLLLGGSQWYAATQAGLLAAVNLTCINLAGVGTFLVRGIRPGSFYDTKRAKTAVISSMAVWVVALVIAILLIWWAQSRQG